MSQRAVLRGLFLCLLTVFGVRPAAAAITFSPDPVVVGVGQTSELITAQISFGATGVVTAGTQTLQFDYLPYGITTQPSPVTYTTVEGQQLASVSFRLVVSPEAYPYFQETPVYNLPSPAGSGLLNMDIRPMSVSPGFVIVPAGSTSDVLTATLSFSGQEIPPSGPQHLVFQGLPPGAETVPAQVVYTLPPQQYGAQVPFQVAVGPAVPSGTYVVTVTNSPEDVGSATFYLSVQNLGGLSASIEKPTVDLCPGGAGVANSVTVTPLNGFNGTATVSFPALPGDLVVTPSSIPVPSMPPARTVAFTVSAKAGASAGPKVVNVLVSAGPDVVATAAFTANVVAGDFSPVVTPAALTLNGGGAAATVTAFLGASACAAGGNVRVTPSGLPPGVTVTPTSAILVAPAFTPVPFSVQASSSAAPGSTTVTFAFEPSVGAPKSVPVAITVCGPPAAPVSPAVRPQGNLQGPVTATDHLALSWGAPASGFAPTSYEWRINGGAWSPTAATSATAPPRGAVDPVQLFVRAYACSPQRGPGPEAASPVYPLAPPAADFSFRTPVVAGQAVTFTDTTSPQATSWLWFPGDGMAATTVQSPTVTFPAAGPKVVVLVATNGSGTSSKAVTVNVQSAPVLRTAVSLATRSLDREPDGRLALERVEVGPGTTLLLRRVEGDGEAVAYLRLVDADGRVAVERRLVLAEGEEARHDLDAWGATGVFRVEVVGPEGLEAVLQESAIPYGGPEAPPAPRLPRRAPVR